MINVVRLIQKIKEKALRDGDQYDTILEVDFQESQEQIQEKIPEKHPGATPDKLELVIANSLCHYFWGKREAQVVFPEEFILQTISEQSQDIIVPRVAPQPETSLVNQSTSAPQQHQTVASYYEVKTLQWMTLCRDNPAVSKMMYEDYRAATRQATPPAQISTQQIYGNISTITEEAASTAIDPGTSSIDPSVQSHPQTVTISDTPQYQSYLAESEGFPEQPPTDLRSSGARLLSPTRNHRKIHVGRSYMAPPVPPTRRLLTSSAPMNFTDKGRDNDEQQHKFKRYRRQKRSSRYHS
ncbi:uncharacterized protein Bfra_001485 [Botrytis fragariae]|uniref:Uncharacterized protein n=1 Tax=Botrytis fragariae TaxID=1964551 RepID=A0A8H6B0V7_9HELO|nr:uncharacterized protein Bfra_001485 [Botrytis fragariae]KAF5877123.1 hypothetical protein Bfra_001485 [Botrytis fragariae]